MIIGSNRKIGGVPLFGRKRSCLKRMKVMTQVRMEVEAGTLLLSSDKNSVIAKNVILHTSAPSLKYRLHILGLNNNY